MKNFDWTTFTRRVAIKSSLTTLYAAWAKASEIEKWFLSNANYIDLSKQIIDKSKYIEQGFTYEWNWFLYPPTESGSIIKANGKDHIQFSFAGNCLVDVKFTSQNEYVIVELTQSNIPIDDNSKQSIRLGCDSGWSFFLVNLKSVYENGYDLRNKNSNFKGMLNN